LAQFNSTPIFTKIDTFLSPPSKKEFLAKYNEIQEVLNSPEFKSLSEESRQRIKREAEKLMKQYVGIENFLNASSSAKFGGKNYTAKELSLLSLSPKERAIAEQIEQSKIEEIGRNYENSHPPLDTRLQDATQLYLEKLEHLSQEYQKALSGTPSERIYRQNSF